jgi:hypothetical protein
MNDQLRVFHVGTVPLSAVALYLRLWDLALFQQFQQSGMAQAQDGSNFVG